MDNLDLKDLKLSKEDSRDIIELLAKKRNIKNYKRKSDDKLLQAIKENNTPKKQPKNKKRIDSIREDFKNLSYKLSKSELKEIKNNLYNIEKTKQFNSKKTNKRLIDLEKKLLELKKYHDHDDNEYRGIKDIKDLFKLSIDEDYYKPVLLKSGYNNNYVQYESKGDRILVIHEYLALIEKYLRELINHYKNKGEWKIQLTAAINFVSLKPGSDETRVMYTRSFNEEIMEGIDTDEIIKSLFESFLKIYGLNLQEKMKRSDFAFDGVYSSYYDFNKTSINRGGSYIDSPQWLKNKKSTINPKNNDDKCFQYAVTLTLNLNIIDNHPERIYKIKPFIDQYNWKDIDFPAMIKDWKKIELNNEIALNILYVPHNTKKINIAYKSKHNLTREKQTVLFMITNGEKWHYLVVKKLSGLLRGITSNHNADFYCLNFFCAYSTKNKLEKHKKICENLDYCHVEMLTKDNNIIKYNHGEKSIKTPFTIYADLEYLLEKIDTWENNPNKSHTTEINKHIPSGYSIFTHCSFDESKNKLNYYRGDDCMEKFCKDLREHSTKIINYEKKNIILLTPEEKKDYDDQNVCYICKKEFDNNDNDKKSKGPLPLHK